MAESLIKAKKKVLVYDVSKKMIEKAKEKKFDTANSIDNLLSSSVTTVITMLPEGKHSKEVYLGENGIINKISKDCLLVDCSTIDIKTSIEIGIKAKEQGIKMIPQGFITGISGGILNECLIRKIRGVTLLAKANETVPDILAAATLIDAVNKVYGTEIDTKDLKKQKNQIGNEFKEQSNKYSEHKKIDSNMYM